MSPQRDPGSSDVYERLNAVEVDLATLRANQDRIFDSDKRKQSTLDKVLEKVESIDSLLRGRNGEPGAFGRIDRIEQQLKQSDGKANKAVLSAIAAGAVVGIKVVVDWMSGHSAAGH